MLHYVSMRKDEVLFREQEKMHRRSYQALGLGRSFAFLARSWSLTLTQLQKAEKFMLQGY